MPEAAAELLDLSRRLLAAITSGDWQAYRALVADDVTCFEPEARGHLVEGLPFHEHYFKLGAGRPTAAALTTTLAAPHVRFLSADAAVVSYVRLTQKLDDAGRPVTTAVEETRVWQRAANGWKHVHFHRSLPG